MSTDLHPIFQSMLRSMPAPLHDSSRAFLNNMNPKALFSDPTFTEPALTALTKRLDRHFAQQPPSIEPGQYETDEPGLIIDVQPSTHGLLGHRYSFKGMVNGVHVYDITRNGECFARRETPACYCLLTRPVAKPTLAEQASEQINALKRMGVASEHISALENIIGQMAQA